MSVREALAMRSVTVDVRLGECRLRASDIWDLQSGDVLVTTRALAEPVMLEVIGAQGHRAVVARGRLGHHGTRLALSVTAMGAGA
jgi:flagellar motor switch protein FliM